MGICIACKDVTTALFETCLGITDEKGQESFMGSFGASCCGAKSGFQFCGGSVRSEGFLILLLVQMEKQCLQFLMKAHSEKYCQAECSELLQ